MYYLEVLLPWVEYNKNVFDFKKVLKNKLHGFCYWKKQPYVMSPKFRHLVKSTFRFAKFERVQYFEIEFNIDNEYNMLFWKIIKNNQKIWNIKIFILLLK
jgi:hypothetical protein